MVGGEISNGLAAIMGALVGGLASLASTWVSERTRNRQALLQREITKRETTYSDSFSTLRNFSSRRPRTTSTTMTRTSNRSWKGRSRFTESRAAFDCLLLIE